MSTHPQARTETPVFQILALSRVGAKVKWRLAPMGLGPREGKARLHDSKPTATRQASGTYTTNTATTSQNNDPVPASLMEPRF